MSETEHAVSERMVIDGPRALAATASPACQPGARPPGGGLMWPVSSPLRAISHEVSELEFHMLSSSRPHTTVGTCRTSSRISAARSELVLRRCGLSTASSLRI